MSINFSSGLSRVTSKQNFGNFISASAFSINDVNEKNKSFNINTNASTSSAINDMENDPENPRNKVNEYIINNSTDEQIVQDIKNYKSKHPNYPISNEYVELKIIKDDIESQKKSTGEFIGPVKETSLNGWVIPIDEERENINYDTFRIPSANNWYDGTKSDTKNKKTIDISDVDSISEKSKKEISDLESKRDEKLKELHAYEQEYSVISKIGDKDDYLDHNNDLNGITNNNGGTAEAEKDDTLTIGGTTYIYNRDEQKYAEDIVGEKIDEIKEELDELNATITKKKENAIEQIKNTDEYNTIDDSYIESVLVKKVSYINDTGKEEEKTEYLIDSDNYTYMNTDEKTMYCYFYKYYGKNKADEYLSTIQQTINERAGMQKAVDAMSKYIDEDGNIDYDNFVSRLGVDMKGYNDGIEAYVENCRYVFSNSTVNDIEYYERLYTLQILRACQKNGNLSLRYQITETIGEAFIPISAGIATTMATQNPSMGATTTNILQTVSTFGSARHSALVDGCTNDISIMYAVLKSGTSYTINSLAGTIPGFDSESLTIFSSALREASTSTSVTIVNSYWDALLKGDEIDGSELSGDAFLSFVEGAILGAGGYGIKTITFKNGSSVEVDPAVVSNVEQYLENNKNSTVPEALKKVAPKVYAKLVAGCDKELEDVLDGDYDEEDQELITYLKEETANK